MIFFALAALAAGAAAGIFLALRHFRRKRLPVWAAVLHGLGGATGFTLVLLIVVWQPAFQLARQALYLLVATVALGCVNLLFHVRRVRHRTSLIAMHAACAVSGVGTLLYAALTMPAANAAAPAVAVATSLAPATPAPSTPTPPTPAGTAPASTAPASTAPASTAPAPSTRTTESPSAAQPSASAVPAVAANSAELREAFTRTINFASASALILPESLELIATIAHTLTEHPEVGLVEVQGHADEHGDDRTNLELTRLRAQSVIEALIAKGVARERLHAAGYGSRCPADPACGTNNPPADCHDPTHASSDRRVVFVPLRIAETAFHGALTCTRGAGLIPTADASFYAP